MVNFMIFNRSKSFFETKKGQIWISALLYTLIAVVSIIFILQAGTPIVNGMRDRLVFTKTKNQLVTLDQQIEDVASEGKGSQRIVPLEIDKGNLFLDGGSFRWEFMTDTKLIESGSLQKVGNLLISSNNNVNAYSNSTNYVIENSNVKVVFLKNGSASSFVNIQTSDLIESITLVNSGQSIASNFNFSLRPDIDTSYGTGYTRLVDEGSFLSKGVYIAHIDSTNFVYDLEISLQSNADFLQVKVKNLETK
jgi:hypothetical protein